MVNESFSEFSYGFAVTSEWIDQISTGLVVPPEFPSLLREGQTGGGWDVFIQTPTICTYLQFKLSEHMVKSTASQYSSHGSHYFRVYLRNRIRKTGLTQHQMLVRLDQRPGNRVLYVAPGFSDQGSWTQYYFQRTVLGNSICFSPKELGEVDPGESHCVSYDSASTEYGYLHSTAKRISSIPGKVLKVAPEDADAMAVALNLERLEHERDWLMSMCEVPQRAIEKPRSGLTNVPSRALVWFMAVYEMAVIARSCLDATLLLVAGG